MIVTVKYFGLLTDITNCSEEIFSLHRNSYSVSELLHEIQKKHVLLGEVNFTTAVNQQIVTEDTLLNNSDIMALLPPFAGG